MTKWRFHAVDPACEIALDAESDDDTGEVTGTIQIGVMQFDVKGVWAAAGSMPDRKESAIALYGSCKDRITTFVALNGSIDVDLANIESVIVLTFTDTKYRQPDSTIWTGEQQHHLNQIYQGRLSKIE